MKKSEIKTQEYTINILLAQGHCAFTYSDLILAQEQFTQYSTQGVINGQLIKGLTKNF